MLYPQVIIDPEMTPLAIKRLRRELRLTQQGLASALGVALPTVGRWECGLRTPSTLAVRAMALLLELRRIDTSMNKEA